MEWLLIVLLAAALVFVAWKYIELRGWVRSEEKGSGRTPSRRARQSSGGK
jgi:hypothetical protein